MDDLRIRSELAEIRRLISQIQSNNVLKKFSVGGIFSIPAGGMLLEGKRLTGGSPAVGNVLTWDGSKYAPAAAAGGGHTLKEDGVAFTARGSMNFLEPDATLLTDDAANNETEINMALYALLSGRSGGQTLKGGTAASQNLTLESTSHPTKGLVNSLDNFKANGQLAVSQNILAGVNLYAGNTGVGNDGTVAGVFDNGGASAAGANTVAGVAGRALARDAATIAAIGLDYLAGFSLAASTIATVTAVRAQIAKLSGTITDGRVFHARNVTGGGTITSIIGLEIDSFGSGTNRYGVRAGDITAGTIARILELGPATPHLRLEGTGNWAPAANTTTSPLWVVFGNNDNPLTKTLRNVQWFDPGNAGANFVAGQRVLLAV